MKEQNGLLPGWKPEQGILPVEVHNVRLTVRAATISETQLAVMDFQDNLEDQGKATVAAANPDKNGRDRRDCLVEICKNGEPAAVHMMIDYPEERPEPDLRWMGTNMRAGQAPLELHPLGETEDDLVPERSVVEDRRTL